MSHYTVAVISNSGEYDEIAGLLAPFDEELEIEKYVCRTKEDIIEAGKAVQKSIWEAAEKGIDVRKDLGINTEMDHVAFQKLLAAETDEEYYELEVDKTAELDEEGNELSYYNPNAKWDWWQIGGRWDDLLAGEESVQLQDIDKYEDFTTYAVLTPDGEWLAPGDVGWFGSSTATEEEEESWDKNYKELINSFDPSLYITIVDCHI